MKGRDLDDRSDMNEIRQTLFRLKLGYIQHSGEEARSMTSPFIPWSSGHTSRVYMRNIGWVECVRMMSTSLMFHVQVYSFVLYKMILSDLLSP